MTTHGRHYYVYRVYLDVFQMYLYLVPINVFMQHIYVLCDFPRPDSYVKYGDELLHT